MVGEPIGKAEQNAILEDERRFTQDMRASRESGKPAEAILRTDDRVLARITDGIYRQPSSALRELISNGYDADATEMYIDTDAPRYSRIEVRDNGRGMDEVALSRLIHHIGGSSKRTSLGKEIGTTSETDPNLSAGGRRLIGKIGIGLFSVSQLTSHFQIITKIKGNDYRLFADVILKTYMEDGSEKADGTFETGRVRVISVPADDHSSQGTQIILRRLHPRARDILRSRERWDRWFEQAELPEDERDPAVSAPIFHSGVLAKEPDPEDGELVFRKQPELPWKKSDPPLAKFEKLRAALADQVGTTQDRPDLATTLDTYLSTLWTLSLSAPIEYLRKHPFDLTTEDDSAAYLLTNMRGRARALELKPGERIRDAAELTNSAQAPAGGFKVFVDEVELRRPITFEWWPSERQAIKNPLMFVGRYSPDLSKIPSAVRGGDLAFEAYLFWNSKIVPKENNGVLVRINGASGALFDDTFMKYQISEQTRLRQVTAEIFVTKGLDAALNIDRESFNFAHPHYALLSNWLHRSLRQLANTQKALSEAIRNEQAQERQEQDKDRLNRFVERSWHSARKEPAERPPSVEVVTNPAAAAERRRQGIIAFDRSKLTSARPPNGKNAPRDAADREMKLKAVATILDGFGLFEDMSYEEQHRLLNAILAVFFDDAQI
ncbi:ATP-binding protein [Mesorhizobium sp. CA16]|uniref:ATP-binding protein n=1 Tax=Mesorhizobium sp. CA16 TaxID=588496 RepID=UPI001CCE5B85|nr:ATP-binding protein [Mesorhizobium sp. CA16]MBZ9915359.1 ATP-binding protein [Mesorhizobium sp. CA16]